MEIYSAQDLLEHLQHCIEVSIPRKRGIIIEYNHHVFIAKVNENECVIYHYSGSLLAWFKCHSLGQITRERLNFSSEKGIQRINKLFGFENRQTVIIVERDDYPNNRNAEERIINRANRRLGEMRYSIVFNNCDSFTNWIFSGDNTSVEFNTASFLKKAFAFILDALTRKGPMPVIMFVDALIRKTSWLPYIPFELIIFKLEKLLSKILKMKMKKMKRQTRVILTNTASFLKKAYAFILDALTWMGPMHVIMFVVALIRKTSWLFSRKILKMKKKRQTRVPLTNMKYDLFILDTSFVFKQPFHFITDEVEENQKTYALYQKEINTRIRIKCNELKFKSCGIKHTNTAINELPASFSYIFSGTVTKVESGKKESVIVSETSFVKDIWKMTTEMPKLKIPITYTTAVLEVTSLLSTSYTKYHSAGSSHADMIDDLAADLLSGVGSTCGCKCGSEIANWMFPNNVHSPLNGCLGGYYIGSGVGLLASRLISV